ncbi:MAG: EamA family transporter RarD [Spirochaetaceae bacterium]|jgi:chloramphenicol-sensitive protein RarD|nr:EamA family transporter RarD [Spirochaetaceae bacterium]
MTSTAKGSLFALFAYLLWGVFPSYWKLLSPVDSLHILAARIVFSLVFVGVLLIVKKNTAWLAHFRDKKKRGRIFVSAALVTINWGVYIFAVNSGHTVEASLGYFINPLISIVLGLFIFRERLKPLQWAAFALAAAGVALLTAFSGRFPFIALALALSFAFYGLAKKTLSFDALEALAAETFASIPFAVILLFIPAAGLSYLGTLPWPIALCLVLAGPVTALPLIFFAKGARLIPLSTLGFVQFVNPILQFLSGVVLFRETFPPRNLLCFALIWAAAILYCVSFFTKRERA